VDVFGPDPKALAAEAKKLSVPALVAAMGYLVEARSRARWAADGRPVAELAVVRLASLAEMEPLPEVLARLDRLQQSLSGGSTGPAAEARTGEKKKHVLSENEGRVPGETEEPGAGPPNSPTQAETMPPEQKAEGQEGPSLPPREPAKRQKLDEAMMDPLIQKAIRLFDGRIVNIED
jgi:hypothetical protein